MADKKPTVMVKIDCSPLMGMEDFYKEFDKYIQKYFGRITREITTEDECTVTRW
jgi:hypothetical protein